MYKVHQDTTLLPINLKCRDYQFEKLKIPALSVSASRDGSGRIHVSICNLDPQKPAELVGVVVGVKIRRLSGQLLTAPTINSRPRTSCKYLQIQIVTGVGHGIILQGSHGKITKTLQYGHKK